MSRGTDLGLGIDWNFSLQEGFINNRGETIIHEIGLRCPCNKEDLHAGMVEKGAHALRRRQTFGCDTCGGQGYIYRKPRKMVAIVGGFSTSKDFLEAGWAYPGDSVMSPKAGYIISGGDRITATWEEPLPDAQVIIRGAAHVNDNSGRKLQVEEDEDLLWYHAVKGIYCEDIEGNTYKEGDFVLNESKVVRWTGNKPRKGLAYTFKYTGYLEWVAFVPPELRRDRDRDLGGRVLLRKRHVALANNDPTIRVSDRVPFCDRLSSLCT